MKTMLLALAFLLPQTTPQEKEIENKISNIRLSIDFQNTPLPTVIDYIRSVLDINILVDGKIDDPGSILITMRVTDLSAKSILKLLLVPRDMGTTYRSDVLMVTSREEIESEVIMELYDVRDLLFPIRDFPGVEISLTTEDMGRTTIFEPDVVESEPIDLEELIQTHTGGDTWDDNPNAAVSLNNGILVIKNTREVHEEVQKLLGMLRANK